MWAPFPGVDWAARLPIALALPGGPVGLPVRWAATSNVEGESGTEEGAQWPLAGEGSPWINYLRDSRVPSYADAHGAGLPN